MFLKIRKLLSLKVFFNIFGDQIKFGYIFKFFFKFQDEHIIPMQELCYRLKTHEKIVNFSVVNLLFNDFFHFKGFNK